MANLRARLLKELGPEYGRHVHVTNFHGFGLRLFFHHAPLAGRIDDAILGPQPGSLRTLLRASASDAGIAVDEFEADIRHAKRGAFTDSEVLSTLEQLGPAYLAYEVTLREAGRLDYEDAIRLGLLVVGHDSVVDAYRQRFPAVLIDEVQDLSIAQFELIERLGQSRTVFAGDSAQGIYGFAGAAPDEVYARIEARHPEVVMLQTSYRSAPNVLALVSRISIKLGGGPVEASKEIDWPHPGQLMCEHFADPHDEATWVVAALRAWSRDYPGESIGVIARTAFRREILDQMIRDSGLAVEIWDYPAHRPSVVSLLRRYVHDAVIAAGDGIEGLDELYIRCLEATDPEDLDTIDDLTQAIDALIDLVRDVPLMDAVSGIRITSDAETPAAPGIHLLNGHVGKGQQFDRVIILGMEDGQLPYYKAKTEKQRREELAVFHVMVSRARHTLVLTRCHDVPYNGSSWIRNPSPWLATVETLSTGWFEQPPGI